MSLHTDKQAERFNFVWTCYKNQCLPFKQIVYYQPNQGIKYSFSLPVTDQPPEQISPPYLKKSPPIVDVSSHLDPRRLEPPPTVFSQRDEPPRPPIRDEIRPGHAVHRRQRRRKFVWKITGVTACSKSCGGGKDLTVHKVPILHWV